MIETFKINDEIEASRLCLGSWQASGFVDSDQNTFIKSVQLALELGINFVDTAESYANGLAEQLVGRALKNKRDKAIIATKFSHTHAEPVSLRKSLEKSLRRLETDYIDLYQYHWPSPRVPLSETLDELRKLKEEGKIRAIGVSNWMKPEWDEVNDISGIDTVQNSHSLLWRRSEKNILNLCKEKNIKLLAYSSIFQGILSKENFSVDNLPDDYRSQIIYLCKENEESLHKCLDAVGVIAEKYNKTRSQIALRWVLETPAVGAAIVGTTKLTQIEENVGALGWKLEQADYNFLASSSPAFSLDGHPYDTLWGWHSRK